MSSVEPSTQLVQSPPVSSVALALSQPNKAFEVPTTQAPALYVGGEL